MSHGAIIRGDTAQKKLALVFTGHEFADGGTRIRRMLIKEKVKASFFLTGDFYRNPSFKKILKKLRKDRHYFGAHSDKHLLYCDWGKRDSLLVTKEEFVTDLLNNYREMEKFGVSRSDAPYFLPPYEWYNEQIAEWTLEQGLQLINFTPGTRSTADYTTPEMKNYRASDDIYQSILSCEQKAPGLNGFILLIHIGTDPARTDKFYNRLPELLKTLKEKGYEFQTVNQLLKSD
ncbi:MAG TPA: polysaccharide deacetylase family protein [Chitinophagaceae bacterium]|nr:polysaccharide deacetylase family protein [Chitinophagaceae bacterium]